MKVRRRLSFAGIVVLAAIAPAALATEGEPAGTSAAQLLRGAYTPYEPGELVVKLDVPAGAARSGLVVGKGAASLGSSSLDALAARHGMRSARRAFATSGRARGGALSAADRAARLRGRHPRRAARAPEDAQPPDLDGVLVLELDEDADVNEAAREFSAHPEVVYAEPNHRYRAFAPALPPVPFVPDDRFITQDGATWSQGAVDPAFPDLYGLRNLRALEAWNLFDSDADGSFGPGEPLPGAGVVVCVVDSGLAVAHPDMVDNLWTNPGEIPDNGIDDDANGFVDDIRGWDFVSDDPGVGDSRGHGAHVAGTVAAVADNGSGLAGVAPGAKVMGARGIGVSGSGTAADLAAAVVYCVDNGADLTQNSWGGTVLAGVVRDAFAYARAHGVMSVAAAGNAGTDVEGTFPAAIDSVVAVAAVDADDVRASFSNFGSQIDVSAPGVAVLSVSSLGGNNVLALNLPERVVETEYLWLNGTSMASPHVAGAAAVLMSRFPDESIDDLRGRLRAGASPIDDFNPGFAGLLGAGRVDLLRSLTLPPSPALQITEADSDPLQPGRPAEVVVTVRNFWRPARHLVGTLTSERPDVRVRRGQADFGDLGQGASSSNQDAPFVIELDPSLPFGEQVSLSLELVDEAGVFWVLPLALQVSYFHEVADPGLPLLDTLPVGARTADYDRDGDPDVALVRFQELDVYQNHGGRFYEVTSALGVDGFGSLGRFVALFFELGFDADPDLLIGGNAFVGSCVHESQGGVFVDLGEGAGLPSDLELFTAIPLDYDRDGATDLLGGGRMPLSLLRNQGDGSFVDVAPGSGLDLGFSPFIGQVVAFDYDGDGDSDVLGVSDASHTAVYENQGQGTFREVSEEVGLSHPLGAGYAIAAGDFDDDGWTDVFLTGLGGSQDPQRNALFRNVGGSFVDVTAASGDLASGGFSAFYWGTAFFDFDNDGDLDLYVPSEGVGARPFPELFRNDGAGRFTRVTEQAFPRGVAPAGGVAVLADFDGDGDIDLYAPSAAVGRGGRGALLENLAGTGNWLMMELERPWGTPDAWGARVSVTAGGVTRTRELVDGPVQANPLHLGLADAREVDLIEITWPDGTVQQIEGVVANRRFAVVQGVDPCETGPDVDGDGIADACDATSDVPSLASGSLLLLALLLGASGGLAGARRRRAQAESP